jgi:glycosyltransferase involved in cell wall biosynthesis
MPFFSIVIPVYNRAHIIAETIESILNQTFIDFEIIIVDDGSVDNTASVVQKLKEKDNRISYYYQKNAERSVARNNGFNQSKGKFVCFLDSDDKFEPSHLHEVQEYLNNINLSKCLVFTNQKILDELKNEIIISNQICNSSDYKIFFLENSIIPGRVFISRDILNEYQFDPIINIVEDTDLWFRISCNYPVHYIPIYSCLYRWHDDNSVNIKYNAYLTRLNGLRITFSKPEAKQVPNKIKRAILSNCYFGINRYYVAKEDFFNARKTTLISIFNYPESRLKEKIYLLLNPRKALQ